MKEKLKISSPPFVQWLVPSPVCIFFFLKPGHMRRESRGYEGRETSFLKLFNLLTIPTSPDPRYFG
jgi:hypothetical protein